MAHLAIKSRGERKWDRIKNKINDIHFKIENGLINVPLLNDDDDPICLLNEHEQIEIISTEEKLLGRSVAVKVKTVCNKEGWLHLNKIRNPGPDSTTLVEDVVHMSIKHKIDDLVRKHGPITLYMGEQHKMENVVDIMQPRGTPKADFAVIDESGQEVGFISHKKGGGAKAFQQYGGITVQSGIEKHGTGEMLDEVDDFVISVSQFVMSNPNHGYSRIYRPVHSDDLIRFSAYGHEFQSDFSLENVNIIGQGNPSIEKFQDGFNLTFDDNIHHNGDVAFAKQGSYQAVLVARPASDRVLSSFRTNHRVERTRGGIFNMEYLTSNSYEI